MSTQHVTDDLRIESIEEVIPPEQLHEELPLTPQSVKVTLEARRVLHDILIGEDDRLAVVVGPCSIHDVDAAMEYARRLSKLQVSLSKELFIVMRVYFEKPRTTVGWKGLINDPDLDDSFQINKGLRMARKLLLDINGLNLPAGTEFLDLISPQYVSDLISWGAIGARTTESQCHRELTSGLSCPVGLKNGTDGNLKIAVDAIGAATRAHHFLGVTKAGRTAIFATRGNHDCHIILRGGKSPNYDAASVDSACEQLRKAGLRETVMIDCSHANSAKQHDRQTIVGADIAGQISAGERRIVGVMIESHLVAGRQDIVDGAALTYGQSITDACLNFEDTENVLKQLAGSVAERRKNLQSKAS